MSTHGNKPSRTAVDNVEFVQIPDSDPSEHGSTGNRKSRQPGDPIRSYSNAADLKFPEGRRYQQMGNPISGGMGVIFKALDLHLDIDVAIKRIRPKFASNEELIKRFEREAKIQVRLKHDHLVQVKDFQRDSNGPYIVMEWIEGQSLASAIKSSGAMQWRDAALLISKVAMALQVAHENDIIHRDVKPGNILLNKHGEPHITDFGLACADAGLKSGFVSGKNVAVGTEYFMSPEQRLNPKNVTYLTDVWSLGATLYQLLTTHDVLGMDQRLIPEPLREIVVRALEREPSNRFGTMKLFAQELIQAVSGTGTKAAAAKPEPPPEEDDIAEIWRKAQERTDDAHADAKALAEQKQDYVAAVRIMESIPEHLRKKTRYQELVRRRDRVQELDATIRARVKELRTDGLRDAITELLKLQPNREEMKKLLSRLPPEPAPEVSRKALTAGSEHAGSDVTKTPAASAVPLTRAGNLPALLAAPFDSKQAKAGQEAWAKHLGIAAEVTNGAGMKFRVIPPGTFDMGSPASEPNRSKNETLHKVTITQPKLLGVYPVTQGEWTKVMDSNPSVFKSVKGQDTSRFPVEHVNWDDSQEFLTKLNRQHAMKGWRYRLPTEAEWEYACRAGTVTPFWFGTALNGKQANCGGNYPYPDGTTKGPDLQRPSAVGGYGSNPYGVRTVMASTKREVRDSKIQPAPPQVRLAFCGAGRGTATLAAVLPRTVTSAYNRSVTSALVFGCCVSCFSPQ